MFKLKIQQNVIKVWHLIMPQWQLLWQCHSRETGGISRQATYHCAAWRQRRGRWWAPRGSSWRSCPLHWRYWPGLGWAETGQTRPWASLLHGEKSEYRGHGAVCSRAPQQRLLYCPNTQYPSREGTHYSTFMLMKSLQGLSEFKNLCLTKLTPHWYQETYQSVKPLPTGSLIGKYP